MDVQWGSSIDWDEGWDDSIDQIEFNGNTNIVRRLEVFQVQTSEYCLNDSRRTEKANMRLIIKVATLFNETGETYYLHLRDDWLETPIYDGNVVNIFGNFDNENRCIADNSQSLVVVNPGVLISATSVADSFICMRKNILSERFNGNFYFNSSTAYGSLFHELIQSCLIQNNFTSQFMESEILKIVKVSIERLYSADLNENDVIGELMDAIPTIRAWADKFIGEIPNQIEEHLSTSKAKLSISICNVLGVEEHICSTKYGLKGKIDASIEAKVSQNGVLKRVIMPLELKTSRNISPSHYAQTIFYCLLMSDNYDIDVGSGLLYYLKIQSDETGKMLNVPAVPHELRSLIIQRNQMAWYTLDDQRSILPPMIKNEFQCKNCSYNASCFLYHKAIENGTSETSGVVQIFNNKVAHLKDHHLDFFRKWDELITLEEKDMYRFQPEIWNMLASNCDDGQCLNNMWLDPETIEAIPNGEGYRQFRCKFIRKTGKANFVLDTQFCIGDHVIVSSELDHRTVASGFVEDIASDFVWLTLDRIPRGGSKCNIDFDIESCHSFLCASKDTAHYNLRSNITGTFYRIDKDELTSGMKLIRQNLVSLLVDEETAKLRRLIVDLEPPCFNKSTDTMPSIVDTKSLNDDQIKAIKLALDAQDYAILLGMPGTGKSTTIVQIIKALVSNGKSILLAAYTHSAVDNILFKLLNEEIDMLRLGSKAKVRSEIVPYLLNINQYDNVDMFRTFIESKQVIATTCLDEATQVTLPICVGPLRFADRFLLVGDDFQLPPLVRNHEAIEKGMGKSLFTSLTGKHPRAVTRLRYQYRMHEDIMNLSNCLIYDYKMLCGLPTGPESFLKIPGWNNNFFSQFHKENDNRCKEECWLQTVLDPWKPVVMVDTDNLEARESRGLNQNNVEASLIEQCVKAMLIGGVPQTDIGIITPFRHQIKLLLQKFKDFSKVEISTVDRFQGREKKAIVVSLVKANVDYRVGDILKDYRRLNVAITRAQSKLIIFGSKSTVSTSEIMRKIIEHIQNANSLCKLKDKNTQNWHIIPK
ncbi:3265_t:CDS:2 [Cetraspora pellucida]|uniref:3265_t:CDS:1 n=1 Tax=Cetraspora pellucida TaxID=1433469 RepID=A0ACA9K4Q6_9GLOM|nr:3265_t:CDS:2 [Cetraspora pellucida]